MTHLGKIPPQAIDSERYVLGAILLQSSAMDEVSDKLFQEAFYKEQHGWVWLAASNLYNRSEPIDLLSVVHELKRIEKIEAVGGAYFVSGLTDGIASAANIQHHARIILQQYLRREVIRITMEAVNSAYDDSQDIFELYDNIDSQLQAASLKAVGSADDIGWGEQLKQTVAKLRQLQSGEIKTMGIPTGNEKLDSITGGWQQSDLIILAGRPGAGKTTRILNFIKHACDAGKKVILFSLEMNWEQITRKFLSDAAEVYGDKMRTGGLQASDIDDLVTARNKLTLWGLTINDDVSITTTKMKNVIRQKRKMDGVDMVVVDYAQLVQSVASAKSQTRDVEVGTISTAMKHIAREFNVPVFLLSQLSRKCEERPATKGAGKRPILSDLRESGRLESDADIVIALYRPCYYYVLEKDPDYKDEPINQQQYERISELELLKNRHGRTKFMKEEFYGEFSRFVSPGEAPSQQTRIIDDSNNPF